MKNKMRASSGDLLACFFSTCESQFSFLEQKHGYSHISGLVEYRKGRQLITPYRNQLPGENFLAACRYEKERQSLEILYGDKEFVIEAYMYYDDIYRLALSEILTAIKRPDAGRTRHWLVTHEDLVQESLSSIASTVKKHWRHFLRPSPKLVDRAMTIRGKRMEQAVREQFLKNVESSCREAAKAFMEKDFISVVALLAPYERDLSAGDAKKLALARLKLLESARA